MIKFYISTVVIWFIIYISSGILLKEQFIKARNKVRKELNNNSKIYGYIRTTFAYFLISCIPFVRLFAFIGKLYMITNTDEYIKIVKEKGDSNE